MNLQLKNQIKVRSSCAAGFLTRMLNDYNQFRVYRTSEHWQDISTLYRHLLAVSTLFNASTTLGEPILASYANKALGAALDKEHEHGDRLCLIEKDNEGNEVSQTLCNAIMAHILLKLTPDNKARKYINAVDDSIRTRVHKYFPGAGENNAVIYHYGIPVIILLEAYHAYKEDYYLDRAKETTALMISQSVKFSAYDAWALALMVDYYKNPQTEKHFKGLMDHVSSDIEILKSVPSATVPFYTQTHMARQLIDYDTEREEKIDQLIEIQTQLQVDQTHNFGHDLQLAGGGFVADNFQNTIKLHFVVDNLCSYLQYINGAKDLSLIF